MAFPTAFMPAAFQALVGGVQTIKGLTMKEGERPEYEVPDDAKAALSNAKYVASQTKLPGEDKIQERMQENMANAIFTTTQAAQDPSQIVAGTQKVTEAFNNQQVDLGIKGAEFFFQNQGQLRGELNKMADREDTKWTLNEYNPYMMNLEKKQSLIEGGLSNIQGGVNSAMGGFQVMDLMKSVSGEGGENYFEQFMQLLNGKGNPTTTPTQTTVPGQIPTKQPTKFEAPNPTQSFPPVIPPNPETLFPASPEPYSPVRRK